MLTVLLIAWVPLQAQPSLPRSAKDGVYTKEQASRGKTLYDGKCASCHGSMASVTPDMAPLLNDYAFQNTWRDRSLGQLLGRIRETMPQNEPGSMSAQDSADIVAYILSANALPPGEIVLPHDLEVLQQIKLDAGQP
jgi:quinoprotein glucose dehydrogenase